MIEKNNYVSPHFTWREATVTNNVELRDKNLTSALDNTDVKRNIKRLAQTLLEPIRLRWNFPVIIHSWYRCADLNKAVGGVSTSDHISGSAVDFHVRGVNKIEARNWIWKESSLEFGQLIDEPAWIHLSLPTEEHVGQVLLAKRDGRGKMLYEKLDDRVNTSELY